jgi:hypothetical protein
MKAENAVAYTEALSIHHGFEPLDERMRQAMVDELHRHPDVIEKFVSEAELRIEKASKEMT